MGVIVDFKDGAERMQDDMLSMRDLDYGHNSTLRPCGAC